MKNLLGAVLAAFAAIAIAVPVARAAWPEKPIKVIVPFNAGGTSDQTARAFAAAIQENDILPQPLIVVNVGGHFSIGARQVMEAAPDGYTFLVLHNALMGGEASHQMNFGYRDFAAVAATGEFCTLPMVRKDSGINSVQDLLDRAKAKPGTLLFGVNLGAINHMAGLVIEHLEPGAKFRFVQIGGGAENFAALTGGQTNVGVNSAPEVIHFTRLPDGKPNPEAQVKPLAYMGPERLPQLPDVPTMKELGFDVTHCTQNWWFAPKGTPKEIVAAMADALEKANGTKRIKDFQKAQAFGPLFLNGEPLQQDLDNAWKQVVELAPDLAKK